MLRLHSTARRWLVLLFVVGAVLAFAWLHVSGRQWTPFATSSRGSDVPEATSAPTNHAAHVSTAQQPNATNPPSSKVPAGAIPVDKTPFDVGAVIERVQRTFEAKDGGFRGGRAEYGVRASADGIALTARHWEQRERRGSGRSPTSNGPSKAGHEPSARDERVVREKPLESAELVLRTKYVGRDAARASGANGDGDTPVLKNDAQLVAWERSNHTEHLRQTPEGVEQSWEFSAKPAGPDDLLVRVDVSGLDFKRESALGLHYADARGLGFLYGHGTWIDAAGVKTAVHAHYVDGSIELTVPRDVVERSAYPAVLDPVVGPEFGGPEAIGPVPVIRRAPIVASNGTDYLVVWYEPDIRAIRVNAAGVLLDTNQLAVSSTTAPSGLYGCASVASNGSDYLVAWCSPDDAASWNIHANRVTAFGQVLDGTGFLVASSANQGAPSVASAGNDYLVVWEDARAANGDIYANRVSASGQVLDGGGFSLSTTPSPKRRPSIAASDSGYLVAWEDERSGNADIYASRLSASGDVLDPAELPVATGAHGEGAPRVVSKGSDYLIAWKDFRPFAASDQDWGWEIYANRVSAQGEVLDDTGFWVTKDQSGSLIDHEDFSVASNGEDFLFAWAVSDFDADEERILAFRVSADGVVMSSSLLNLPPTGFHEAWPRLASNGSDYLISWVGGGSIYTGHMSAAGTVDGSAPIPAHLGAVDQFGASVASNGKEFLVAWEQDGEIHATRVSSTGEVLDESGLLIGRGSDPSLASNGTDYLVSWWRSLGEGDFEGSLRPVSASGDLGDPKEIQAWGMRLASNGTDYLVVGNRGALGAVQASATGEVRMDSWVGLGRGEVWPDVASNGTDYLVVWKEWRSGHGQLLAKRVSAAGESLDEEPLVVSTAAANQADPAVASNGQDYLVVWQQSQSTTNWDIYACRVTADGEVQDPDGFAISTAPGTQTDPQVASNGTEYMVTFEDAGSAMRGARVTFEPSPLIAEFLIDAELGVHGASARPDRTIVGRGDRYLVTLRRPAPFDVSTLGMRFITEDCSVDPLGDVDGDVLCGSTDNCPDVSNFGQEDADGDGTGDVCDSCPSDEHKVTPGECGCGGPETGELDSDSDGTRDCHDECPSDANKVKDFDLDADGTLNCNDGCPTNPMKMSPGVCGCNASDADTDGDGAPDCEDPCPDDEHDACVDSPGQGGGSGEGSAGAGGRESDVSHASDDDGDEESGCGCRTAGAPASSSSFGFLLVAAVGLSAARRRLRAA